jgi:hypothetical protein
MSTNTIKFSEHLQGLVNTFKNPQTLSKIFKAFYILPIDIHNSILWSDIYSTVLIFTIAPYGLTYILQY